MTRPFTFLGGRQRPPRPPKARRRFLLWIGSAARRTGSGYSLPEVMISSVLLAAVVASSVRLTSSSILGMNRSKLRNQISTAMSERVETLRLEAFRFLCEQGCTNNELTQEIRYDLAALKPRCSAQDLGSSFLAHLQALKPPPTAAFTVGELSLIHI